MNIQNSSRTFCDSFLADEKQFHIYGHHMISEKSRERVNLLSMTVSANQRSQHATNWSRPQYHKSHFAQYSVATLFGQRTQRKAALKKKVKVKLFLSLSLSLFPFLSFLLLLNLLRLRSSKSKYNVSTIACLHVLFFFFFFSTST